MSNGPPIPSLLRTSDSLGLRSLGIKGQVVLEYVLLMIIAVALATLVMRTMVKRDPENPGFLIGAWVGLLQGIGNDNPDAPHKKPKK